MDDMQKGFTIGIITGIGIIVLLWIFVVKQVERCKVDDGYLTFNNKTYKVTLFDSLDKPEKLDSKD